MRVGIRAKEVALLTLVALLPLLAALAVIVFIETGRRTQSFGLSILSVAVAEARAIEIRLAGDVEKLELAVHQPAVVELLSPLDNPLPPQELARLDRLWAQGAEGVAGVGGAEAGGPREAPPEVQKTLEHPIVEVLRLVQGYDRRIAEILVTDRHGQLVAATGWVSDFYQADESWWQQARGGEEARVYITRVNYDHSAEVWSVDLCVPIVDRDGRLVGVAKVVLDAGQLIGGPTRTVGEVSAPLSLIAEDGSIIFAAGEARPGARAEEWTGALTGGGMPGWRRMRSGDIQALAPIHLPMQIGGFPVEMPTWTLSLVAPASAVRAPIMRLGAVLLACGMVVIAGIFIGGLALVEREVVGRIRRIGRAAKQVAAGDLGRRAPAGRPLLPMLGRDEIDDLTDAFNEMVSRLEKSYRAMEAADELKTNFIRVAGHELRTPVSYIIGIGALLKGSRDPERLSEALQNASAKGRRLEEIIRAMFKLMPEEAGGGPDGGVLRRERVDLRDVTDIVAGQARVALERRKVRLAVEADPALPEIEADRAKVRDMIENLVMNAVRFTAEGGQVLVRLRPESAQSVRIEVENEGAQVPEEDVAHLFEPFYCARDVMTHSTGEGFRQRGMGLGLAIVRHFARLHGGEAMMRPGERGPVFEIVLPIAAIEPAPPAK